MSCRSESLQASPAGIQRAKRAFALKGWTQENLAGEVNLKTRQPIWRLFTGQPVDRQIFMDVCQILDLEWREIASNPPEDFPGANESSEPILPEIDEPDIDTLVATVRSQHRETIQQRCSILQLLDIHHPVNLDDIYVDVNILEELASQQWGELTTLNDLALTDFDRVGLGTIERSHIPGMQAVETYAKLRVLGKPGVGKTTFLQHLAVQCNRGEFAAQQVPMFIALREFAEQAKRQGGFSLFGYIQQAFPTSGMADPTTLETLLQGGRVLLLMDGMDEVPNPDITPVVNEIRSFADKYHRNRFVVSCRTAAQRFCLRGFTDVEIAPFTPAQIQTFAQKWFRALSKAGTLSGPAKSRAIYANPGPAGKLAVSSAGGHPAVFAPGLLDVPGGRNLSQQANGLLQKKDWICCWVNGMKPKGWNGTTSTGAFYCRKKNAAAQPDRRRHL